MRKGKLLNGDIIEVIGKMGHKDEITIADSGLPISDSTRRIDLALKKGIPSFVETLKTLLTEYNCEEVYIAKEITKNNPNMENLIKNILKEIPITYISHDALKDKTKESKAVIRTGECSPYANIILKSGVNF